MAKDTKKTNKTAMPKRSPKNIVTTDDGVTTDDNVTTDDRVITDETVSTNGGVIVDSLDEDQRDLRASEVAKRAYAKYEARGFIDGHDVDDWLAAEAEL